MDSLPMVVSMARLVVKEMFWLFPQKYSSESVNTSVQLSLRYRSSSIADSILVVVVVGRNDDDDGGDVSLAAIAFSTRLSVTKVVSMPPSRRNARNDPAHRMRPTMACVVENDKRDWPVLLLLLMVETAM